MERKYIVIHVNNRTGIVYRDSIEAILSVDDEICPTEIRLNGTSIFVTDKYADIVKQMLK